MSSFTEFKLPSGAVVLVQSSQSVPDLPSPGGVVPASGIDDKARETWESGVDLVRELAAGLVAKLREATAAADEVTVEFGVNIAGKTGLILVEGSVAANLKVKITWKRRSGAG
jgi:Trypsin-co-occurring domain 1